MKQKIKTVYKHPLISGSSIIFSGSLIANIFNYIFNLLMGRMLSVEQYGLLYALSSMFILISIFQVSFTNIITRFAARYHVSDDEDSEYTLFVKGFKYILIASISLFTILILLLNPISSLLKVENAVLLWLIFGTISVNLLISVPQGILQGKLKFVTLSIFNVANPVMKLIISFLLVFSGLQIIGAVTGIFISTLVSLLLIYGYVGRNFLQHHTTINLKNEKIFLKNFVTDSYSFIITSLGITILSNTDVILVRYFFPAETAGQYAALSLMGKAIFYFTVPINSVFFPLIAQKKARKERLFNTVMLAVGIITLTSISMSFVYFTFPGLVLRVFFPADEYRPLAQYLGLFSLYILIYSLVVLFKNFFLSIGKTQVYKFTIAAALIQTLLILQFHDSLYQIIGVLFGVNTVLFGSFLVYYFVHGKD